MNGSQQPHTSIPARGTVLIVVESCIFLVMDLSALAGNGLVCIAFYRQTSLRTVTNNFILSLALTDLSMAVFIMPLATISSIANKWIAGEYGCQISGFGGYILGGTSLITVMLLAVNRYFRVVRPARYPNIYSKKRSAAMAVCAWITTAAVAILGDSMTGIRFQVYRINPTRCFVFYPNKSAFLFFNVAHSVYIAVPSLVIVACYIRIYQTIHQHNTTVEPSSQEGHSAHGVEEAKMTKLLTMVVIGFYLCWLPLFITSVLDIFEIFGDTDIKYKNFYYIFPAFASSVINPVIYATMSRPFRTEFLKIVRGL